MFVSPALAYASVFFSEIMYDLEGSDEGREWVEVWNDGSSGIDLTSYKFRENNTNHSLVAYQGSGTLAAGGYAIIADDPVKFLSDHSGFSGTILDSSFSLSNTGETLVLKDSSLVDLDSVTYTNTSGAAGDGNSLQKSGSSWVAAAATPGAGYSTSSNSSSSGSSSGSSSSSSSSSSSNSSSSGGGTVYSGPTPVESLYAYAGEDRSAVAGADIVFKGKGFGLNKEPLVNARYLWSFGDGSRLEGESVIHAYRYPGEYFLSLTVSSGALSGADYAVITVRDPEIRILNFYSGSEGYTEIENASDLRLDLSRWQLTGSTVLFTFPDETYVLARRSIRFPNVITGLYSQPILRYPNGREVKLLSVTIPAVKPPTPALEKISTTPVVKKTEAVVPRPTLSAAAAESVPKKDPSPLTNTWYLGLLGLAVIGVAGAVLLRRSRASYQLADEFEIVE